MHISRKSAAATLTAAAMLVVGVDYATFAANGDSLILGSLNHAHNTTMLVKNQPGPALRLTSRGNLKPSLAVSSNARVPHLNADLLDGQTATTLASNAVTYRGGARGDVFKGLALWPLPIKPGIYQVSFKAFVITQDSTLGTVGMICGVADLNTIGPNTRVYTADSTIAGGGFPALLSGAESVRISASANPGMVCSELAGDPAASFTLFKPMSASFTPISQQKVQTVQAARASVGALRDWQQQFHK